jgi:hypothetical protein
VQEGIAFGKVRVRLLHAPGLVMDAENMDRQSFGAGEELVVAGTDRAREIARAVDDGRPRSAEQGVRHLADNSVDAIGDDRGENGVDARCRFDIAHCRSTPWVRRF